jgi:hypothetical protein
VSVGVLDALVGAFFLACIVPIIIPGAWTLSTVVVAISQWGLAFLLGRLVPDDRVDLKQVYGLVAVIMACVAGLAVVEFVLTWNPFVEVSPPWSSSPQWRGLQERGGITRAEGAFGHSIALGCSLALAVPLALGSRIRPVVRNGLALLLVIGSVVSFSRVGMIAAVLGLLLSLLAGPGLSTRARAAALVVAVAGAAFVLPAVLTVFEVADEEASGSAGYRVNLLQLVPSMESLGLSGDASFNQLGALVFFQFRSIDSALILLGLVYGWIALVIALSLLAMAVGAVVLRRAAPPTISIVAQIPALISVALITQYAMLFWFVAGLSVAAQANRLARSAPEKSKVPIGVQDSRA